MNTQLYLKLFAIYKTLSVVRIAVIGGKRSSFESPHAETKLDSM